MTEFGSAGAVAGSSSGRHRLVAAVNAWLIDTTTGEMAWAEEARRGEATLLIDDRRMFEMLMRPVIQQLTAGLKAADL